MYVVLDRQQRQSEPGVGENETERNEVGGMRSEYAGDPTGDDLIHTVEVLDIHDRRDEDARYPRSEASVTWIKDCVRIVRVSFLDALLMYPDQLLSPLALNLGTSPR